MTTPTREQVGQIPEGDRFKDEALFRVLGKGAGDKLYEVWGSAVHRLIGLARADLEATIVGQAKQLKEMAEAIRVQDEVLKKLIQHTPSQTIPCKGVKCREWWCYSCNTEEDAERAIQEVFDDCAEAGKALSVQPSHGILAARDQRVAEAIAQWYADKGWLLDESFVAEAIRAGHWKEFL